MTRGGLLLRILGWTVGLVGGTTGLAVAALVVWIFRDWDQHFNRDATFDGEYIGSIALGLACAAGSIALGWVLVCAGRRRDASASERERDDQT